jgi:UDP-N-acetylmuramate--alanine ligase
VFVTSVYGAGEEPIPNATADRLVEAIRAHGHPDVTYVEKRTDLAAAIRPRLKSGDIVITLGAGDITHTGPELLASVTKEGI